MTTAIRIPTFLQPLDSDPAGAPAPATPTPGSHLRPSALATPTLGEADLNSARWLRQRLPDEIMDAMLDGDLQFVTKPAHRFIPGQDFSICGAKAHKGDELMIRAAVPAERKLREGLAASGRPVCRDCVRMTWSRSDTLMRNCSDEQMESLAYVRPDSNRLTPAAMHSYLDNCAEAVLPARLVSIGPCTHEGEPALRLHLDSTDTRAVAYTPVSMLLPHLGALRKIHRPRTILISGL